MNCVRCGKRLKKSDISCPFCGKNIVRIITKEEKKQKRSLIISIVFFILSALGAGTYFVIDYLGRNKEENKIVTNQKPAPVASSSDYKMEGNGLEDFDIAFLKLENQTKNKIYSPLSIKYALAMLSEGAKENSKTQIDNIIGNYQANKYINSSNMSFANAMFIKNSYKNSIKKDYTTVLKNKYNADVLYDSFNKPDFVNGWVSDKTFKLVNNLVDDISELDFMLINALAIDMEWKQRIQATESNYEDEYSVSYARQNFHHSIPILNDTGNGINYEIIKFNDKIDVQTLKIGAAINKYDILYALGEENIRNEVKEAYNKWLDSKECGEPENQMSTEEFLDKYIEEIDSNYLKEDYSTDFEFYVDEEVKVFAKELKDYNGTTLEYIGIMPQKDDLLNVIKNMDADSLSDIIKKLKKQELNSFNDGVVTQIVGNIPIFNFDYELNLMEDLKKLGITDVFSSTKADLSNMTTSKKAYISDAAHKANIDFSNDGIKAAAVTMMGGKGAAGCYFTYNYDVPIEVIDLTFDKPYIFLIRDKNTGEIWFTGTVYEPTQDKAN